MARRAAVLLATPTDAVTGTSHSGWSNIALDHAELQRLTESGSGESVLQFWESNLAVSFSSVETSTGYTRGMGRLRAPNEGMFSFVWDGALFAAVLHDSQFGIIEINTDDAGHVRARRVDATQLPYPRCSNDIRMPDSPVAHGGATCPHAPPSLRGYGADDGSMIDIMFVYTSDAVTAAGGVAQLESRIELAVTDANNMYQNSTINPRIRAIRKALIAYTETGVGLTDLTRLSTQGDGFLESVHPDRDTYGADLVHLWVNNLNAGGVAWSMAGLAEADYHTAGFCVMRQDNYVFHTLAHETGHNFGCDHDRANTAGGALFNYSYGYREPGNLWHDIMAYDPGQTIPYFSNPDMNYNGPPGNPGPMGVPLNQPLPCHNVLTHNNTAWFVANYRPATLTSVPPSRLYVNAAAAPGGSGASWATAIKDLQVGLGKAAAARGAITEVWVAAGTYKPDVGSGDRLRTFRPVQGVSVYGGFAGTETLLSQRNVATNVTILSGDIGVANDVSDNSYHIIDPTDLNSTAILDGFRITGGNANGAYPHDSGGAMRSECNTVSFANCTFTANRATTTSGAVLNINGGNPTFTNCTFSNNIANSDSGAIRNDNADPVFTGCTFSGNSAPYFGAVVNYNGAGPTFLNCNFTANTATNANGAGGALRNDNAHPVFTGCTFSANVAPNSGATEDIGGSTASYTNCTFQNHTAAAWYGASYISGASPTFSGCTFTSNSCGNGGGAMAFFGGAPAQVTNCNFNTNSAGFGGAIYTVGTNVAITGCTFTGNSSPTAAGVYCYAASPTISGCNFNQNHATSGGSGGGVGVTNGGAPAITNCQFIQNTAEWSGAGLVSWASAPLVTNCIFRGNTAQTGGGAYCETASAYLFNRCTFLANSAQQGGGGMQHSFGANGTVANCSFSGNTAPGGDGGAINAYSTASPTIVNCSFSRNTASNTGGGFFAFQAGAGITNCLFWGNSGSSGQNESGQITQFSSTVAVNYTSLQGHTGALGGTGNNGSDPQFVDYDGPDNSVGTVDDNLALSTGSTAIDSASKSAVPAGITTDLPGNPRFVDVPCVADTGAGTAPLPDRGAYEFLPGGAIPGDTNGSGTVNTADITSFIAVLLGTDTNPAHIAAADMNCDSLANGRDVRGFVLLLTGP